MEIVKPGAVSQKVATSPLFTGGPVTLQFLVRDASAEFNLALVNFDKGARNKFHQHSSEQVLIVTRGRGIVALPGDERVVETGDVIVIPAGEKHWHGATADSEFSHIALEGKGSKLTQLED